MTLDPHQWGTPVREYTDADVGEMLSRYDGLRAKFYPKVVEPEDLGQKTRTTPAPRAAKVIPSASWAPWTTEETELLRYFVAEGYSSRRAARKLGRSANACAGRADRLGLHFVRKVAQPAPPPPALPEVVESTKTAAEIIKVVADGAGISVNELLSDSRTVPLARARQYAMWLCARDTKHFYTVIGKIFGRDHTTVLHAVRRENDRLVANVRDAGGVPANRKRQRGARASQ